MGARRPDQAAAPSCASSPDEERRRRRASEKAGLKIWIVLRRAGTFVYRRGTPLKRNRACGWAKAGAG
jgi:hypothetical protein